MRPREMVSGALFSNITAQSGDDGGDNLCISMGDFEIIHMPCDSCLAPLDVFVGYTPVVGVQTELPLYELTAETPPEEQCRA